MQDGLIAETWSEVSFHDLPAQISGAKSSTASEPSKHSFAM